MNCKKTLIMLVGLTVANGVCASTNSEDGILRLIYDVSENKTHILTIQPHELQQSKEKAQYFLQTFYKRQQNFFEQIIKQEKPWPIIKLANIVLRTHTNELDTNKEYREGILKNNALVKKFCMTDALKKRDQLLKIYLQNTSNQEKKCKLLSKVAFFLFTGLMDCELNKMLDPEAPKMSTGGIDPEALKGLTVVKVINFKRNA